MQRDLFWQGDKAFSTGNFFFLSFQASVCFIQNKPAKMSFVYIFRLENASHLYTSCLQKVILNPVAVRMVKTP